MERYSRLLELSSFSIEDLQALQLKKILIIGCGGVGQHIATYLVTNGILKLTLVDFDKVELSNLNRQILLTEEDVGKYKVEVVKKALDKKNSDASIITLNRKIDSFNAHEVITDEYDLVIDALDNWEGKFIISDECHKKHIPFLHVGVDGTSGQFCIFKENSLRDIFSIEIRKEKRDGVMGPLVGIISSMACNYLIEFLLNKKKADQLISFDSDQLKLNIIKI